MRLPAPERSNWLVRSRRDSQLTQLVLIRLDHARWDQVDLQKYSWVWLQTAPTPLNSSLARQTTSPIQISVIQDDKHWDDVDVLPAFREPCPEALRVQIRGFQWLDIAFNNAGIAAYMTTDDVDQVLATNVKGVWLLVKHEVVQMRKQGHGGSIVNTSSVVATGGSVNLSIYSASQGALDATVRALALEIGRDGVRINNVSPGVIDTPATSALPPEAIIALGPHSALGRIGQPDDIAGAVTWLSSPEAAFVTGQSILVDGGYNIGGMR